jgi:hypothetical protein
MIGAIEPNRNRRDEAREIFIRVPSVKKALWGGEFWSKGYFINAKE